RKHVDAGKLPELNAVDLESVVAADGAALTNAKTSASQSLLQMKALLNLDAAADFNIATPPVDKIPVEPLAALQPDA
ncbi:MAG: TolC family protein, partial [Chitinophagaceae bacterium]|nr:TolC family protein [Chitinophagaceae bacterium]